MNRWKTYWRIWLMTAENSLQEAFINRSTNVLFILGKVIRLTMSLVFLLLLKSKNITVGDYTSAQMIIFFLTYQLIDLAAQIFYRGVYFFGSQINSGDLDLFLAKPVSPLFRALTGRPDINDVVFFVPNVLLSIYLISTLPITVTFSSVLLYLVLLANGFLIATGLHILVLVAGIITTEVENTIWMYRDLTRLGQIPISIFVEPIKLALFFIVPIGFMITIPAQVLLNTPPSYSILFTLICGVTFLFLCLQIWKWGLKQYSSASS